MADLLVVEERQGPGLDREARVDRPEASGHPAGGEWYGPTVGRLFSSTERNSRQVSMDLMDRVL
ncbi:hypothetical protein [Streptomyces sp. NPDC054783]